MSLDPCQDIRFKLYSNQIRHNEDNSAEKENKPSGAREPVTPFRGRGRGLLNIQKQREQNLSERKYIRPKKGGATWLNHYRMILKLKWLPFSAKEDQYHVILIRSDFINL